MPVEMWCARKRFEDVASQPHKTARREDTTPHSATSPVRWLEIPQDLCVVVCQLLGVLDVLRLLVCSRRTREVALMEDVWLFFCRTKWGISANVHTYKRAKDLFLDSNGWFPRRGGRRVLPYFKVDRLQVHHMPCTTMDLRCTDEAIIAVSEAPRQKDHKKKAHVNIIDPSTRQLRDRFEVSEATINCCDVQRGWICLGSEDSKVRAYRYRDGLEDFVVSSSSSSHYQAGAECKLGSAVNDLRLTLEDTIVATRTHQNRHPAGLDLIRLDRPDAPTTYPGASWATKGKYIHALDGFEDGCSLSAITCAGEHPLTSAFSAMLFDFRRPVPCVADVPVTTSLQGVPLGTMLWPLRAGCSPKVYANLLHMEGRHRGRSTIAMVDFRYPAMDASALFQLPEPIDDFRYFGGQLYAACSGAFGQTQIWRCNLENLVESELLCNVVDVHKPTSHGPKEDLKIFSICQRGFALSHGESIQWGMVAQRPDMEDILPRSPF